jgi:hypothetical protein
MNHVSDFGCKYGQPHSLRIISQNDKAKWEVCDICGKKFRWNKRFKGRVENNEYLKAHVRNFCQKSGATKRIYHKIYKPEIMKIKI